MTTQAPQPQASQPQVFQVDPVETLAPYAYERETIRRLGGEMVIGDCHTPDDVLAQGANAEIMLLSWKNIITPAVMDALPRLRLIIRWGVGYDMIDVAAATARGIAVANTPTYAVDDVAEHTIALLLCAARRVAQFHQRMQQGEWTKASVYPIHRLKGRTLGLIGMGRIGQATAKHGQGLGLRVIAHDKVLSPEAIRALGVEPCSLQEVLAQSDYISLHVPLTKQTHHLLNADSFAQMRPDAILINTSRGPVIDENALIAALARGQLGGAALDVFNEEPLAADSPLRKMEQVILTPHVAAYSLESWHALRVEVCDTVRNWIDQSWAPNIVNPEVQSFLRPRL